MRTLRTALCLSILVSSLASPSAYCDEATGTVSPPALTPPSAVNGPVTAPSGELSQVAPGHCEADRKKLRAWLVAAKARGVGLGNYMKAYDDIEASVKGGATEDTVRTKVAGLCGAIGAQVKASNTLQRQRPIKPVPKKNWNDEIRCEWVGKPVTNQSIEETAQNWRKQQMDLIIPEQRANPDVVLKVNRQYDEIKKEMHERKDRGETLIGPRRYQGVMPEVGLPTTRSLNDWTPTPDK